MIVYIESNFILELAYLQEKYESCERILSLAETYPIVPIVKGLSIQCSIRRRLISDQDEAQFLKTV
jgi:hypothetical protein